MSLEWAHFPMAPWWELSIYRHKVIKLPFPTLLWCEICNVRKNTIIPQQQRALVSAPPLLLLTPALPEAGWSISKPAAYFQCFGQLAQDAKMTGKHFYLIIYQKKPNSHLLDNWLPHLSCFLVMPFFQGAQIVLLYFTLKITPCSRLGKIQCVAHRHC